MPLIFTTLAFVTIIFEEPGVMKWVVVANCFGLSYTIGKLQLK